MTKPELDELQERYIKSWPDNHSVGRTANLWEQLTGILTPKQQYELYQKAVKHANKVLKEKGSKFRYVVGVNTQF